VALAKHVVGARNAERMFSTARLWSVDEASSLGIIDEAVEPQELLPHCESLMQRWIAGTRAQALANTKATLRRDLIAEWDLQKRQSHEWARLWESAETQAALAVFKANLAARKSKL